MNRDPMVDWYGHGLVYWVLWLGEWPHTPDPSQTLCYAPTPHLVGIRPPVPTAIWYLLVLPRWSPQSTGPNPPVLYGQCSLGPVPLLLALPPVAQTRLGERARAPHWGPTYPPRGRPRAPWRRPSPL
ncbi:hypothetical protein G9A89_000292 [Geosiphon pyriformis]|nr:hypothetical protein G9A89_000292 [Geosiphon pyriformis]